MDTHLGYACCSKRVFRVLRAGVGPDDSRSSAGLHADFWRDGFVGPETVDCAGKQVSLRFHPAPSTTAFQCLRAQRYMAVLPALTLSVSMRIRVLSISSTLRRHSSARRVPVDYMMISMAR
jgi:hypothetical protein